MNHHRRRLIRVAGVDAASFLQGILTADVATLSLSEPVPESTLLGSSMAAAAATAAEVVASSPRFTAQYSLLLTPQGKVLYDFFVLFDSQIGEYYLACSPLVIDEIHKKLQLYRLRAAVTIERLGPEARLDYRLSPGASSVLAGLSLSERAGGGYREDEGVAAAGYRLSDPRLATLGLPLVPLELQLTFDGDEEGQLAEQAELDMPLLDALLLRLAVPQFGVDFLPGEYFPFDLGFENFGALSYSKGCYVGQEVVTRTKFRGQVRKFVTVLLPVNAAATVIANVERGAAVISAAGRQCGAVIGTHSDRAVLALIRDTAAVAAAGSADSVKRIESGEQFMIDQTAYLVYQHPWQQEQQRGDNGA